MKNIKRFENIINLMVIIKYIKWIKKEERNNI